MTTAHLTDTHGGATLRIHHDDDGPVGEAYPVYPYYGETLAEAAGTILAELGWQPAGKWTQTFGGITGATYEMPVQPAREEATP